MDQQFIGILARMTDAVINMVRVLESSSHVHHQLDSIEQKVTNIMSAISDFVGRQNAFNDRLDAAVDGVAADVQQLKALIEKLQNSPGQITPEDQALLDQLETRVGAAVTKLEALDAMTPPEPPPAP